MTELRPGVARELLEFAHYLARASRESKKATPAKVFTDEDLEPKKPSSSPGYSGDLGKELDRVRKILRGVGEDAKADHGRDLSDYDKKTIADGVKPLRFRVAEYESTQKKYKDELAEMEKYYEAEFQKTFPHDRPLSQTGYRSG